MKAQLNQTAKLILWVAVIVIILPIVYNMYQTLSKSDDELCRLSVMQHAKIKDLTSPLVNTEIECNRKTITFKDDRVEVNGRTMPVKVKGKTVTGFDRLTDDIVNQVVADEMYRCWRKMGAGELDVFNANIMAGENRVCLVCAQINFDVSQDNTYKGLVQYLNTHTISAKEDEGMTYMAYINRTTEYNMDPGGIRIPWSNLIRSALGGSVYTMYQYTDDFDTKKSYNIYFWGLKPSRFNIAVFADVNAYFLITSETGHMSQYCTYIYN